MGNAAGTPGAPASRIIEGALNHSGWLEEEMNGGGSAAVLTELNPGLQVRDFVQSLKAGLHDHLFPMRPLSKVRQMMAGTSPHRTCTCIRCTVSPTGNSRACRPILGRAKESEKRITTTVSSAVCLPLHLHIFASLPSPPVTSALPSSPRPACRP